MTLPFQFRGNQPPKDQGRRPGRDQYRPSRDRRARPRHEFTFRAPVPTAQRPLLSGKRETTPEQLQSAEGSGKVAPKFASLDALSDSEEAEMEFSDDSEEEEGAPPRKKQALGLDGSMSQHEAGGLDENGRPLTPAAAPAPAPTPKWSNPDPYTALPPPDDTQHKKIDMIKLIRKARLTTTEQPKKNDAVVQNEDFISLGAAEDKLDDSDSDNARKAPENAPKGPRGLDSRITLPQGSKAPTGPKAMGLQDDQIKVPSTKLKNPPRKFNTDGSIHRSWQPSKEQDTAPWMHGRTQATHMPARLHSEIIAFYSWVKPHDFEQIVRADLVRRLDEGFRKRYRGSQFQDVGRRGFGERKGQIYAFAAYVRDLDIAVPGSIETIAHARVPILKFVDKLTGLRVDLSFDNDSGLLANRTFNEWKRQFPEMPIIVSVIKQFLLLRGLNEVPTGGLGGFSITCLVTSMLQHMPRSQHQNLGDILRRFFTFYGNDFNWRDMGIRMNPPGYFNKLFGKRDRLAIEDPNNPANDISGGTREVFLIFQSFSNASRQLDDQMNALTKANDDKTSILKVILGANFDEYVEQREQLYRVYMSAPQFAKYRPPPPPPPESPPPPPPPAPL
ncbi:hypothetical protein N7468_002329 [Penicillium chermesinum]|uniref:polynucleotide adenylyltransferase n=1 Tax=Penicillium chermesinum TaxID=63820 RepID=A0A9W9PJX8_9EURO|nr:uncharacterized protein N7468_002329 [Penicillium chermesinum]KAJ5247346.1 hypothetical protein N7468_002329 [Penicillium chermesinum]